MSTLLVFGRILASCAIASMLHELTHLLSAKLVGRDCEFKLREWCVVWGAPETPTARDWSIAASPLVVGLAGGAAAVLSFGVVWWAIPGWYLYTLHGALTNDLALHEYPSDVDEVAEGTA